MRIVFIVILLVHGLIHFFGFAKAFGIYEFKEITGDISKPAGLLWLSASLFFLITVIFYTARSDFWWLLALISIIISQIVIIFFWSDARYGTIANVIILLVSVVGFQSWKFEEKYRDDYTRGIERTQNSAIEILSKEDTRHLPALVREYLEYAGVINKPKVKNFKAVFEAEMRSKTQDWFKLTAEQHNFLDRYERFFFLDAKFKGMPTQGYHLYKNGKSSMTIKLLSTIPVAKASGDEMFEAETVTLLNDMCFLAPATLIDERIQWEEIDNKSVKAVFTNNGTTVSAILFFNEKGQLVNFESHDRYDVNAMKKYKFSTPLKDYRPINGFNLASYGEAVWHYPDGEFVYGRFHLKEIEYNVSEDQEAKNIMLNK